MKTYAFPNEMGEGMTLRDWFAGQYLIYMAHPKVALSAEEMSYECYAVADAMMKARSDETAQN